MPLDVESAIRDYKQAGEFIAQYDSQIKKLKRARKNIASKLRQHLHEIKQESFKTTSGFTVYTESVVTPTGADWDAFFNWIKERDAFDALEKRISRGFIKEYMEKHEGGIPPGVSVFREKVARIRKTKASE